MNSPNQLSVDVAQMIQIGKYHLPDLAHLHHAAAIELDAVEYLRPQLFLTPASPTPNSKSVSYAKWLELYARTQQVLHDTTVNLADAGTAVVKAAEAYYDADLTTSEKLDTDDLMKVYEHGDSEWEDSGMGAPPPEINTDEVPSPNETPSDEEIYEDGADIEESDLVSVKGKEES
ncbi:hypothetical protein LX16_4100 [Stackebrandtia albiflava]|uniref:Excreted virulence factor EspC (Type VII ESX diderm) n=1 Tax=Stackebrandtia albiflava TaxID=406432 RepID=A0A562UYG5_9ACTN|nr:hypothetical protein [Stackebrandtia albiflava]TWJ10680.1 hypothetical protein LX16_4100 [Stackebrandtia albiflava]